MSEGTQRRLAAIVSADVVGYSRLLGSDETATLNSLRAHRAELIDPLIDQYDGRIVKSMGDGLLLEFPSVVNAVKCALAVQKGMVSRNAENSEKLQLEFRVGINLGDVVVDGDDIFGDGVNIAARLERLAEPGGICISAVAFEETRGRIDAEFADLGEQSLKNIARPIRALTWRKGRTSKQSGNAHAEPDKPSIVILPFSNSSNDADQAFLADGLTEDITTLLSQHRWLFVIANNTAVAFKKSMADAGHIADELGVKYLLEGSVRRSGERVRISAQLMETESNGSIWAERFDRVLTDVFDLQDEIAASIAGVIEPNLFRAERARLERSRPGNLSAWECVVRATPLLWEPSNDGMIPLLEEALRLDPKYARAYSLLAAHQAFGAWRGTVVEPAAAHAKAVEYADLALEIDGVDPWAQFAKGMTLGVRRQTSEALRALDIAIKINPNFAIAHAIRGIVLAWANRVGEALEEFDFAERLSPRDPFIRSIGALRATALFIGHRYEDAVAVARECVDLAPNSNGHLRVLAASCAMADLDEEAQAAMSKMLELTPAVSVSWMQAHMPISDPDSLERYIHALVKAGLPE